MNIRLRHFCLAVFLFWCLPAISNDIASTIVDAPLSADIVIKGKIIDAATGEEIIGAAVILKEKAGSGTVTGLDGSFVLSAESGNCTLLCTSIGYKDTEIIYEHSDNSLIVSLEPDNIALDAVYVTATSRGRTESAARGMEKASHNVVNIMSAKAIELSPDMTVANAVKRMSGVTIEKNSNGEGQYAILRGMDKRYNYTLVNGVKIPSPDNKNRFVPLDIFPAEMLDRLEVAKSLTAQMEGDGIGGSINLVMKDAPERMEISANLATGYNSLFINHDYSSYNHKASSRYSPYELKGMSEEYSVSMDDFSMAPLRMKTSTPLPDIAGGLSFGNRFFGGKLGLMLAASYNSSHRGKDSNLYYQPGTSHYGTEYRFYSTGNQRSGAHAKLDWRIAPEQKLILYAGYMNMDKEEVKDAADQKERTVRMEWNRQSILNLTLKGEHSFLKSKALELNWSAVWSKARNITPDNIKIFMRGSHICPTDAVQRRWEHNSDRDIAGYLNLGYTFRFSKNRKLKLSAGGMYRDKIRDSFFNEFSFDAVGGTAQPQYYGRDWTNFDELQLTADRYGNIGDPLNYDASEKIGAAYLMAAFTMDKIEMIAGLRAENTAQGYVLKFPRKQDPEGMQKYTDFLPSFHVKYAPHEDAWLKFSYYRAVNRPGFFEIVPYTILYEDYIETGNPDLKHAVADNLDLRYEFFPGASEQFMLGLFYKKIRNPIEYGLVNVGQATCFQPLNFGNADNFGLEADVLKYFRWFGIKANYTYTHSAITTSKKTMNGSEVVRLTQTRPLAGQAAHVANLSLMFKSAKAGIDAQISANYTGKRLSEISEWYQDDIWEAGYVQLDVSIEKRFKCGLEIFAKGTNLTDSPTVRFISKGPHTDAVKDIERYRGNVLERREWHGVSLILGIRFKLNKK